SGDEPVFPDWAVERIRRGLPLLPDWGSNWKGGPLSLTLFERRKAWDRGFDAGLNKLCRRPRAGLGLAEYALFAFWLLFVIVDPFAAVLAFLAVTARQSALERLHTARVAWLVAVGLMVGFALIGQPLFRMLGITMQAFQIAAALVLLLVALDML